MQCGWLVLATSPLRRAPLYSYVDDRRSGCWAAASPSDATVPPLRAPAAEQSRALPCYSVLNPGQSNPACPGAAPSKATPLEPEADSPAAERARSQAGSQHQTETSTPEHSRAQPCHSIARPDQSRSASTAGADGTAMPPESEPISRRGAWGRNSALLSRVRDELRARECAGAEANSHYIHADDLARLVQRVRSEVSTEDCLMHADMLVRELERDEDHHFCDTVRRTRKDLANLMHVLLAQQSLPQKKLRIKQVAHEVVREALAACVAPSADAGAADAMTPSSLAQWLDPEHQASLVDQMLTRLSTGWQPSAAAAWLDGAHERLRGEALACLQQHRGHQPTPAQHHTPQRSRTPSPDPFVDNTDDDIWEKTRSKRRAGVISVRASQDYVNLQAVAECGGTHAECMPKEPNPEDRSVSQRAWTASLDEWRTQIAVLLRRHGIVPMHDLVVL